MQMLRWQTHLHPVVEATLILGLLAWLFVLYRRQRAQHSAKRTAALVTPKVLIVLLLLLAYFDPIRRVMQRPGEDTKCLALVDTSSSMDVADEPSASRAVRADELVGKLTQGLRSCYVKLDALEFDSELHDPDQGRSSPQQTRETDLGKCLVSLADKPDISDYMGVVLITDGGDELVQNVKLPEMPVYITGVGTEPATWNDLAVLDLKAPSLVEQGSYFDVAVDITARCASADFGRRARMAGVNLEAREGDGWQICDTKLAELRNGKARVQFRTKSPSQSGTKKYRVRIEAAEGELSELNNGRVFRIEVHEDTLPVLLFAQEVGWDFSTIRKELARDPLVALTSLFRISDERFIVQGHRQEGDQNLEAGFPSAKEMLNLYRCVIVGSFPASQWKSEQLQALVEYVREGGAVIFLGGEHSFGQGGYAGTVIEPLFPWQVSGAGRKLQTGRFVVNVPVAAANSAIISETAKLISQSVGGSIDSISPAGPLRRGAISLLNASVGDRTVPVIAFQRYGQGHTMAVATNTLWKWTRIGETLKKAYSHFWRQAVRNLSQWEQGERFLAVDWDQPSYRPGEQAQATIHVAGRYQPGQLHLKASLTADEKTQPVHVETLAGRENVFRAQMAFAERTEYVFTADAYVGERVLESYQKVLAVEPKLNEGAKLEVDHAFLDNLAARSGGAYFREADFGQLIDTLAGRVMDRSVTVEMPLVQDRYVYVVLFLGILMLEWFVRRKMNLF